jgi:hypothetical protein
VLSEHAAEKFIWNHVRGKSRFVDFAWLCLADWLMSFEVVQSTRRVEVSEENRPVSCRHVQEVKANFDVCEIQLTHVVADEDLPWRQRVRLPRSLRAIQTAFCVGFMCACLFVYCTSVLSVTAQWINVFLGLGTILIWYLTRPEFGSVYNRKFYYVPHLVTCILNDYDRTTNFEVAQASVMQRFRRLSCFPLPDRDAVTYCNGTCEVVLYLLSHRHFFAPEPVSYAAAVEVDP